MALLHQLEYLIHGDILPLSISRHRMSERLVIEKVHGDGYQDSTWGAQVGHVKAFVGVESDDTARHFNQAGKYLTLFLHLYTLQAGQPYVVFRPLGTNVDDFTKLGERSDGYPRHNPIKQIGEPFPNHVRYISRLNALFQQVESDYENITDGPLGLAMQFFYDAVMSNHRRRLELAVVHFMMAAEALVISGEESKRQNVSRRIGALIAESDDEYEEIYNKMKKMYDIRSGIVHGGRKVASPKDVQTLYQYLRKAIFERLSLRHISKKELVKKLDEILGISVDWERKSELQSMRTFQYK